MTLVNSRKKRRLFLLGVGGSVCAVAVATVARPTGARLRVLLWYNRSSARNILLGGPPLDWWRSERWGRHNEVVEIRLRRWGATARSIGSVPRGNWSTLSPDGRRLAQGNDRGELEIWPAKGGTPLVRIAVRRAHGGSLLQDASLRGLAWDGATGLLAYTVGGLAPSPRRARGHHVLQLLTADARGGVRFWTELEAEDAYPCAWSPTGGWIALAARMEPVGARTLVFVARGGRRVLRGPAGSYLFGPPVWHPSGERVCMGLHEGSGSFSHGRFSVGELDLARGVCRTVAPGALQPLVYTQDGKAVLVARWSDHLRGFLGFGQLEVATGALRRLAPRPSTIAPDDDPLAWSVAPDRRSVAVILGMDGSTVCLLDPDTLSMRVLGPGDILGLDQYWTRGMLSCRLLASDRAAP